MSHKSVMNFRREAVEREKSESCCISLMALLVGSYEDYTAPQPPQARTQLEAPVDTNPLVMTNIAVEHHHF